MIYVLICKDKRDHLQVRLDARPDHLAYLEGLKKEGRLKFAGPFLDTAGKPVGSMVAVEAGSRAQAEAVAADDPYAKAGLFETVEVHPWNWTVNNPENG